MERKVEPNPESTFGNERYNDGVKSWKQILIVILLGGSLTVSISGAFSMSIVPYMIRIDYIDQAGLEWLARWVDIWEVDHGYRTVLAAVDEMGLRKLDQAGYQYWLDAEWTEEVTRSLQMGEITNGGVPGYPCYRTVEESLASMQNLAQKYQNLVELVDIGDSWEKITPDGAAGFDILGIVLTNQYIVGPKPRIFVMAEIHARELATAELALRFGEELAAGYGVNAEITWLLDYNEVHIYPMTNPDGRKFAEAGYYWRKNTNNTNGCTSWEYPYFGTDLNRNSTFLWGGAGTNPCGETYQGSQAGSEPETQSIEGYVRSLFADWRGEALTDPAPEDTQGVFLTLHSFGEYVLYPWGWSGLEAPNNAGLRRLGLKFGYYNRYLVCQSGATNCLYPTTGSTDDWAYGTLGIPSYTFELGSSFFQDCFSFLNTIYPQNRNALLYAIKAARKPYVLAGGPVIHSLVPEQVILPPEGGLVTASAVADDTLSYSRGGNSDPASMIIAARWSVDAPSWVEGVELFEIAASDGVFDETREDLQVLIDAREWGIGRHLVFVEAQDATGAWGVPSAFFVDLQSQWYLPLIFMQ